MTRTLARLLAAAAVLLSAACSPPPEAPPIDEPPEPQATALRDAIQAPLDKAHTVEDTLHQAADSQRRQIDAAGL
ncbi:hypothetical protein [Luteimonas sp. A478]